MFYRAIADLSWSILDRDTMPERPCNAAANGSRSVKAGGRRNVPAILDLWPNKQQATCSHTAECSDPSRLLAGGRRPDRGRRWIRLDHILQHPAPQPSCWCKLIERKLGTATYVCSLTRQVKLRTHLGFELLADHNVPALLVAAHHVFLQADLHHRTGSAAVHNLHASH